ncbi:hypothetical protein RJ639_004210 [Escallonia herrerae]|uniref:NPH3 domain-containing protein n=1 Tax=Escallonia herrerae TaxID=1293975 RepID=A0AA89B247_9ASTE|nr:hypothetical protein RJ639_004210 [Escallonia herrerae]
MHKTLYVDIPFASIFRVIGERQNQDNPSPPQTFFLLSPSLFSSPPPLGFSAACDVPVSLAVLIRLFVWILVHWELKAPLTLVILGDPLQNHRRGVEASSSTIPSENEQRELIEIVIANLLQEKTSRSSTVTRILFGLLRTANILNASEECKAVLEKKIGSQLEQATLDDLLIPS